MARASTHLGGLREMKAHRGDALTSASMRLNFRALDSAQQNRTRCLGREKIDFDQGLTHR